MKVIPLSITIAAIVATLLSSCSFNPCPNGYSPVYRVSSTGRLVDQKPTAGVDFELSCRRDDVVVEK
jgi:hypothetical protein